MNHPLFFKSIHANTQLIILYIDIIPVSYHFFWFLFTQKHACVENDLDFIIYLVLSLWYICHFELFLCLVSPVGYYLHFVFFYYWYNFSIEMKQKNLFGVTQYLLYLEGVERTLIHSFCLNYQWSKLEKDLFIPICSSCFHRLFRVCFIWSKWWQKTLFRDISPHVYRM